MTTSKKLSQKTQPKSLSKEVWYKNLVEEAQALITEAVFVSRWALVEGYWNLGKLIREDSNVEKYAKGSAGFLQDLAISIGISERTLYYALQAYDKYPRIERIPDGKNISWNKLIKNYLTESSSTNSEKKNMIECPNCGHQFEPKKRL